MTNRKVLVQARVVGLLALVACDSSTGASSNNNTGGASSSSSAAGSTTSGTGGGVGSSGSGGGGDVLGMIADAMGGADKLAAVKTQSFMATVKRFDRYEAFALTGDVGVEQGDFTATIDLDFTAKAQHGEWTGVTTYVNPGEMGMWTEISSGQYGKVSGIDSQNGGPPDPRPMLSSQVTARWKQLSLASPNYLVAYALANKASVKAGSDADWNGKSYHVLSLDGLDGSPQPVRLFVDPATNLPAKVDTLEDDPMLGDSLVEIAFDGWQSVGGVKVPLIMTHSDGGVVLQQEQRTMVVNNPTLDSATFTVEAALQGTFDQALADWGKRSSQYLLRFQSFLFPLYGDASKTVMQIPVIQTPGQEIAFFAANFYNTMIVEMPTYLIAVEGPFYESVSQAVLAQIKQHWPTKPIKYIVNTHMHFDHAGGVRAYAAEGAEVLTAMQNQSLFDGLMKAPHTVLPDALAKAGKTVKVTGISDTLSLTDGARTVVLYNIMESHSDGHLIVYVPDAQLIFMTDLYNPGTEGPMPTMPQHPNHDKYAKELVADLAALGLDETKVQKFVGGHGYTIGYWDELRIFAGLM